jgi:hypothetical protein
MSRIYPLTKLFLVISLPLLLYFSLAHAHRSGCHRWHSCPSDRGTYECGDLGYCSYCPDNQYCEGGQPRRNTSTSSTSHSYNRSDVREAQRLLNTLGYDAGAPDGIYGSRTRKAIRAFNYMTGHEGIEPVMDAKLLTRLRAEAESK